MSRSHYIEEESVALKHRNDRLEDEVGDLKLRLEAALECQERKAHLFNTSPYEEVCNRVAQLEQEQEQAETEHTAATGALQEKLTTSREKYKKLKQWKEDLEQAEARADEHAPAPEPEGSSEGLPAQAPGPFDALAFMRSVKTKGTGPTSASLTTPIPNRTVRAQKSMMGRDRYISFGNEEVAHKSGTFSHLLRILPEFAFNTNPRKPDWQKNSSYAEMSKIAPGDLREIFYHNNSQWFYYGTYECVGLTLLPASAIKNIGPKYMSYAERHTTFSAHLLPAIVTDMIHNLYATGILKVACFGFQYVGFNTQLDAALHPQAKGKKGKKGKGKKAKAKANTCIAGPGQGKRKHIDDQSGSSRKKAKLES